MKDTSRLNGIDDEHIFCFFNNLIDPAEVCAIVSRSASGFDQDLKRFAYASGCSFGTETDACDGDWAGSACAKHDGLRPEVDALAVGAVDMLVPPSRGDALGHHPRRVPRIRHPIFDD